MNSIFHAVLKKKNSALLVHLSQLHWQWCLYLYLEQHVHISIARAIQLKKFAATALTTLFTQQLRWPLMPLASPKQRRGSGWRGPNQRQPSNSGIAPWAEGIVPLSHSIWHKSTWSLQRRQSQEWLFHNKGTNSMNAPRSHPIRALRLISDHKADMFRGHLLHTKKKNSLWAFLSLFGN